MSLSTELGLKTASSTLTSVENGKRQLFSNITFSSFFPIFLLLTLLQSPPFPPFAHFHSAPTCSSPRPSPHYYLCYGLMHIFSLVNFFTSLIQSPYPPPFEHHLKTIQIITFITIKSNKWPFFTLPHVFFITPLKKL